MNLFSSRSWRPLTAVASLVLVTVPAGTRAATLVNLGHAAGLQCAARSVNDAGTTVGNCKPQGASSTSQAWVAFQGGGETSLGRLAPGQRCTVGGISNGGVIVGACQDAGNVGFAVTWSSVDPSGAPRKLLPLPSLLGLANEVSSAATAFNQSGVVGGLSIDGSGRASAVIWFPGSSVPRLVSAAKDNCAVVDMTDSPPGAFPAVLLNCPDAAGRLEARLFRPGFPTTVLSRIAGSTHCVAAGIDNASRIVGTCAFSTGARKRAVLWASPAAPVLLPPSDGGNSDEASAGLGINNAGHMVFAFQRPDGHRGAAFLSSSTDTPIEIAPLEAGTDVQVVALSDNDVVVIEAENASGYVQSAVFDPATGVSTAVTPLSADTNSVLTSVSMSGIYAAGLAEDEHQNSQAVLTTLP